MDQAQALNILGLEDGASLTAIRQAVAVVGSENSDDRDGLEEVIDAGRILGALSRSDTASTDGTALVLRDQAKLEKRRASLALERLDQQQRKLRREQAEAEVKDTVNVRVDPLRRAKRRYTWLGGVSGLIGAFGLLLRGIGGIYGISEGGDTIFVVVAVTCAAVGAVVGLFAAAVALQVQSLEGAFQDVAATLSQRTAVAATLKEILGAATRKARKHPIAERDLERAVADWIFSRPNAVLPWPVGRRRRPPRGLYLTARRMGARAFTEVLVSKAKECGLVAAHEELKHEELVGSYRIYLSPRSDSAPEAVDAPPLAPEQPE